MSKFTGTLNFKKWILYKGECIYHHDIIVSENGCFYLIIQDDGNLVIYRARDNKALWATSTDNTDANELCMQVDGNLVLYSSQSDVLWHIDYLWTLLHVGNPLNRADAAYLRDDGQLVLIKGEKVEWSSGVSSEC